MFWVFLGIFFPFTPFSDGDNFESQYPADMNHIKENFTRQLPATKTVYILNKNAFCLVDVDILITEYCKIAIQLNMKACLTFN